MAHPFTPGDLEGKLPYGKRYKAYLYLRSLGVTAPIPNDRESFSDKVKRTLAEKTAKTAAATDAVAA